MKRFAVVPLLILAACAPEPEAPPPTVATPAAVTEPPPVVAAPQPEVAAQEVATVEVKAAAVTTPPRHDARTLVYLASYKTEKSALAGYATLAKHAPLLAKQKPVTQSVDLGKKGHWVRLYALAADEAERGHICKQVGKRVDECGARNRE